MGKHTPGPWFQEVHDLPLGKGKVISIQTRKSFDPDDEDDDPTLASIYSLDSVDFANANLIAAAPDLLEAAEMAMAWWSKNEFLTIGERGDYNLFDDEPEFITYARAAIAKARGES